ncbi:hypothetical protein V6Z12_A05G075300 [Gossypium hirsutum]
MACSHGTGARRVYGGRAGAWREAYGGVRGGRTGLKAHGGCCCGAGEKGVT